jgi:hypothetical protein
MKKGRFSIDEMEYIEKNYERLSAVEIGAELDRDPDSIDLYIKRKFKVGISSLEEAAFELEDRPYWTELALQFTQDELKLFKYHWTRIINQFKDDVIPTEELQVVDLIKLELLMNRCLKNNKDSIEQISTLEALVQAERARDPDQQDRDQILNMERQMASYRASQESMNRDYRELQAKKNGMLKEMRATREQRVKRLEDSRQSFTGWMIHLMTHPEQTRKYGLEMEKMRLGMENEKARLAQLHKYEDGIIDQPFLTPDTVKD